MSCFFYFKCQINDRSDRGDDICCTEQRQPQQQQQQQQPSPLNGFLRLSQAHAWKVRLVILFKAKKV